MIIKDGAFALIFHKQKLLLFHRDDIPTIPHPNCWQLPGGGIEKDESPFDAVKRELSEEVSYVPRMLDPLGPTTFNVSVNYLFLAFIGDDEAEKFKLGPDEGQGIKFLGLKEINGLKLTPGLALFCKELTQEYSLKEFPSAKQETTLLIKNLVNKYGVIQ